MSSRWKLVLSLFFTGFFLGTLGDYCHVISHTDGYPPHVYGYYFRGMPFWVPFLFGSAALAIGLSHLSLDRRFPPSHPRPGTRNLAVAWYGLFLFLGLYAVSGFLRFHFLLNHAIMAVGALLIWFSLDRTRQGLFFAFLTAVAGAAVEISMVHEKIFFYYPRAARLYGVPDWLPWLYVAASVAVGNFARCLSRGRQVPLS